MVTRGEVWLVRLEPTEGGEIKKTRPCLIVSPPELSPYSIYTVAPLTSRARPSRFRPAVRFLGRDGFILIEQIRTVARSRLIRRLGELDASTLTETLAALREMFSD